MAIKVRRESRERRTSGTITFPIVGSDAGNTIDFMGIAGGFRILDVNITVEEAFDAAGNTIEVGIEDDTDMFVPATAMNEVKGIGFNNFQYTAPKSMAIVCDVKGTASTAGKATITVVYAKQAEARQEY